MCTFIGIESLVANALIELFKKNHIREVSFDTLVNYGTEVVRVFQKDTGEEAILLISKKYQINMIENYSEFFEVNKDDNEEEIFKLKDNVSIDDLEKYFRWTMSIKLIEAFMNSEALQKLGITI